MFQITRGCLLYEAEIQKYTTLLHILTIFHIDYDIMTTSSLASHKQLKNLNG